MEGHESPQHLQQQQIQRGLHACGLHTERMETQPPLVVFKPLKLHVPASRPISAKG